MVPCSRCGKEVPEGVPFCPYCGNTLRTGSIPSASATSYQPPYSTPAYAMDDRVEHIMKRLERLTYVVAIEAIVLLVIFIIVFFG